MQAGRESVPSLFDRISSLYPVCGRLQSHRGRPPAPFAKIGVAFRGDSVRSNRRKARGQRHKRLGTHKSAISIMATKPPNLTIGTRPAPADRSKVNDPARRSRGRVVYVAALLAIGSAGGLWAYQRLGRPGDIDALWAEAEADFVAGRYDRVDIALKRLGRLRKPSPLDWMLRGQYAAAPTSRTGPSPHWCTCPINTTWPPRLGCWPDRSS